MQVILRVLMPRKGREFAPEKGGCPEKGNEVRNLGKGTALFKRDTGQTRREKISERERCRRKKDH